MVKPYSGPADLANQVVVLTGATGDIGRATTWALADCGALVIATDIHKSSDVFDGDQRIQYRSLDVTSKAGADGLIADVLADYGRLDIAVLAAGIATTNPIDKVEDDEWARVMDVNVYGVMNLARAVVPPMRERGFGKIVAIGSVAGRSGGGAGSGPAYAASKGAVHALIRNIARNTANQGIYANAIAPGPISGTMWEEVIHGGTPPEAKDWVPTERYGVPSDIAQAIVYLASPQSNWVTGQVLDVNGGMLMA